MIPRRIFALACFAIMAACSREPAELSPSERARIESVMTPGMSISAATPRGSITIRAMSDLDRSYRFGSTELKVTMWPRKERWNGSLGLYYPAPDLGLWPRRGIYRAVVEEGEQRFDTTEEALSWLRARTWMPFVYRNDGLVVGWDTVPQRNQLNAEVWQIYVKGRKPQVLPGATDARIAVTNQSPN